MPWLFNHYYKTLGVELGEVFSFQQTQNELSSLLMGLDLKDFSIIFKISNIEDLEI